MKQMIRVNGEWVDTKAEEELGRFYFLQTHDEENTLVWYYDEASGKDYCVGILEGQKDYDTTR